MMEPIAENNDLFTLRFYNEKNPGSISPESFTVKELGQILISIEDAIISIIKESDPLADVKKLGSGLSLVSIENSSESLRLKATWDEGGQAIKYWGESYSPQFVTHYGGKSKLAFEKLHRISKQKRCSIELTNGGTKIFKIDGPLKEQPKSVKPRKVETIIYGIIEKIGGTTPKAWIKLDAGNTIHFALDILNAQILSGHLYKRIGLKGTAEWDSVSKSYTSFIFKSLTYTPGKLVASTREFRNQYSGFWNSLNSDEEIMGHLRGDNL